MDKKLWAHDRFMGTELKRLESVDKLSPDDAERLWEYHLAVLRDLQHERLIHLLLTLCFAGLTLLAGAGTVVAVSHDNVWFIWSAATVTLILLVTELAYIRHYYRLETGLQRLYTYTTALHLLRNRG